MKRALVSVVSVLAFIVCKSQTLELIADINPGIADGSSHYSFVKEFNGNFFFPATHPEFGRELSILTNDTILLVKDLTPGATGSSVFGFFEFNSELLFVTFVNSAFQIWKTDGTEQGTSAVLTFSGSTFDYSPFGIESGASKFYFTRNGNLYVSDGSQSGTKSTDGNLDIYFEENFPFLTKNVDRFNEGIAFILDHGTNFGLYSAVDTSVSLLGSFPFSSDDSYSVLGPFEVDAGLIVAVRNGDGDVGDLYLYNKTNQSLAKYSNALIVAQTINRINSNKILITTFENGCYSTDGTVGGTAKLINTSANPYSGEELPHVRIGDAIMFHGDEPANADVVHATNGTIAGTRLVRSIPGNGISNFVAHGEYAFWVNDNAFNGKPEIWSANINNGGATRLYEHPTAFNNVSYEISPIGATADKVYFSAKINDAVGKEVYAFTHNITTPVQFIVKNTPYEIVLNQAECAYKILSDLYCPIEVSVFDVLGKHISSISTNTNEWLSLPTVSGMYPILIRDEVGTYSVLIQNIGLKNN